MKSTSPESLAMRSVRVNQNLHEIRKLQSAIGDLLNRHPAKIPIAEPSWYGTEVFYIADHRLTQSGLEIRLSEWEEFVPWYYIELVIE